MEALQTFFTQLFTELNNEDSIAVLFFLAISFLIGLFFGRISMRAKYRRANKALKQKESELISLQAEFDVLQKKYEESEARIKDLESEINQLKVNLAKAEDEKMKLQSQLLASADQFEKLKNENATNLSRIGELNNKIAALEAAKDIRKQDAGVKDEMGRIQNAYTETLNRLGKLEGKLNKLEVENSTLRSEVTSLKDLSSVAFVDVPLDDNGEPETQPSKEQLALEAKKNIQLVLGKKIPAAKAKDKDDLSALKGVGPFIEGKLNEIGIYTYEQVSKFDNEIIALVTDAIQYFPGRIKKDNWPGQAKKLLKKK